MRYGFGLVSLLVGVGLLLFFFTKSEVPKIKKGQEVKEQTVQPWTGKTAEGVKAQDSVKVDGQERNGSVNSLLVTDVTPGGFFEQYYGLQKGDKILEIGNSSVSNYNDTGMAEAMLWQSQDYQSLTVLRNGQKLTLTAANGTVGKSGAGK